MKFKPGDRVRVIDNTNYENDFKIGDVFIIHKQFWDSSGLIEVINESGYRNQCYEYRFELAYIKEFTDKLDVLINEDIK